MNKLRDFFRAHPLLREAFLWAIPALVFGAALRALMMSYLPYGFWGADSRSNYGFAHSLIHYGGISIGSKRRFLYPLLMFPISLLPGGALRWLPWFQHTLGVVSLLPLAYAIRKTLRFWKLWIVPITVVYAGIPTVLWCEHEMIQDSVLFAAFTWAFGGWLAWVGQATVERSRRMFWWFLVPFALFILNKPAGRFVWPGIIAGLVIVAAWRLLTRNHTLALLAVLLVTPAVGSSNQGAWLFYTATFPLTRLDTPLHAEYKAELRDLVTRMRGNLDIYWLLQDREPYYFLRDPQLHNAGPLWTALGEKGNERLKNKIYMDLALEGIEARPDLCLYLDLERVVATSAYLENDNSLFSDGALTSVFARFYQEAEDDENSPIRLALALPKKGPIPPYEEYRRKLEPAPGSWPARAVQACAEAYGRRLNLFRFPNLPREECRFSLARPTFLCVWVLVGVLLSLLPRYRRTLGVWAISAVGYIFGVYIVAVVNAHYFVLVWPVLLTLLAIPLDVVLASLGSRWGKPVAGEK
jgi:hypothetical protein